MKNKSQQALVEKIKNGTITVEDWDQFEGRICQRAVELALKTVPQVVDHVTKQAFFLRKTSHDFYKNNKELVGHEGLVVQMIEQIEGEYPGLTYDELLDKVAPMSHEAVRELKRTGKSDDIEKPNKKDLDDKLDKHGVL